MKRPLPKPDALEVPPARYQFEKAEKEHLWPITGAWLNEVARKVLRPVRLFDKPGLTRSGWISWSAAKCDLDGSPPGGIMPGRSVAEESCAAASLFFLVKFTAKECYAHDFLRGHLFCNTVDYYRKLERSGQGDKYEGLVGWFQPSLGTLTIEGRDATAELPGPVGISRKEIRFHHLFCMYAGHIVGIPPTASDEQVEARMQLSFGPEEFGEHAVLVSNVTEFISRAERALSRDGHAFRHDLVGYYDPVTFHGKFTDEEAVLRKQLQRFGHQREYRFDIDNGEMEDVPLIVEVGDLSDIAELYSWNELNDLLGTIEVERRRAGEELP